MPKLYGAPTLDSALGALTALVREYERRGEKTIVFCEDKLTLLAERAVLDAAGGTFLTEVTTFARFLSGSGRVLSKQGSVMEISALTEELAGELRCFGKGAAQAVYETIAQLSASRVSPEMLRGAAGETEGLLSGKLSDLALLLEKYGEFLRGKGMVDENGYLALLPEKISRCTEENIVFFAFPSFTGQAREGIAAALCGAHEVTGVFLAGEAPVYTNEALRVFSRLAETGPVFLGGEDADEASELLRGLYLPAARSPRRSERVFTFEAADEEEEFDRVAAYIRKHVFESGGALRYRDIAVLVPDEESFPVAEKVFARYKIPFYADKKRPFSEHPFCRFVRAVLDAVSDGVLPDEADAVASNVYFGGGDDYRNYLLKYGKYRGAVKREIKEGEPVKGYDRESLVKCREKMLSVLGLFPRKAKGSAYAQAVRELYRLTDGDRVTEKLQTGFSGAEREFLDPSPLEGALSEIETVAGERAFSAREFAQVLGNGLDALSVSMIPTRADAVFVGDATESKFSRVRILFATGMTDALPRAGSDTAVITDREIGMLGEISVEIEPAIAQVNARARESLALNLCSFSERLYLSRPLKRGGKETERSEILEDVDRVFRVDPAPSPFPFDCCERESALLSLLSLRREFSEGKRDEQARARALHAALLERGEGETLERLLSGGKKGEVPLAGDLSFAGGTVSPTLLEDYFKCPFAEFAAHGLRLREREETAVAAADAGTFLHAVLQEVGARLNGISDGAECSALAERVGRELLASPRFSSLADTDAGAYTGESLVKEGVRVALALFEGQARSAFRVRDTEKEIEISALSLKGKTDRVDESGDLVRIIDYKTGTVDDSAVSYYVGKNLQLELYLNAVGGEPAGAFYFPAADPFTKPGEHKFRMTGFYCSDGDVLEKLDSGLSGGKKSELFTGSSGNSGRGMSRADFGDFLSYSVMLSEQAEREMRAGYIEPTPYEGACEFCKFRGLCGFDGEERKEKDVSCADIAAIARRGRGRE